MRFCHLGRFDCWAIKILTLASNQRTFYFNTQLIIMTKNRDHYLTLFSLANASILQKTQTTVQFAPSVAILKFSRRAMVLWILLGPPLGPLLVLCDPDT